VHPRTLSTSMLRCPISRGDRVAISVRPATAGGKLGSCQPFRELLPFGPVIEALRGAQDAPLAHEPGPIAGALRPLLPELAEQLPPQICSNEATVEIP
jgi:hypothetical protein